MVNSYELFEQVAHPNDVDDYYHIFNSSNLLNSVYWWEFFNQIRGLDGDIIECGVGRGRSLITIASIDKLISTQLFNNYNIYFLLIYFIYPFTTNIIPFI